MSIHLLTDFSDPATLKSKITETYSLICLVPPGVRSQGNKLLVPDILSSTNTGSGTTPTWGGLILR